MKPGGTGFSFADMSANLAGIAFAVRLRNSPGRLLQLVASFRVADHMPDPAGLREGLTEEVFARHYGSLGDERFRTEMAALRKRIELLPGHR
jgi:hypothetical protein